MPPCSPSCLNSGFLLHSYIWAAKRLPLPTGSVRNSQIYARSASRFSPSMASTRFTAFSMLPPKLSSRFWAASPLMPSSKGQTRPWPVFPLTDPERLFPVAFYPFLTLFYVLRAGFCPLFMESGSPTHRSVSPAFPPPCLSTEAWSAPKARAGQESGPIPQYHRPSGFCAGYTKGYPARHR